VSRDSENSKFSSSAGGSRGTDPTTDDQNCKNVLYQSDYTCAFPEETSSRQAGGMLDDPHGSEFNETSFVSGMTFEKTEEEVYDNSSMMSQSTIERKNTSARKKKKEKKGLAAREASLN
jgi:hypothetical protein